MYIVQVRELATG